MAQWVTCQLHKHEDLDYGSPTTLVKTWHVDACLYSQYWEGETGEILELIGQLVLKVCASTSWSL